MLGRYAELKAQLPPGTILFYQVGTFFETFEEDAKTISRELSIRLTGREAAGEGRVPLAEVPEEDLSAELERWSPKEMVVPERTAAEDLPRARAAVSPAPRWTFEPSAGEKAPTRHLGVSSLKGVGLDGRDALVGAAGALIQYLASMRGGSPPEQVVHFRPYDPGSGMVLDSATPRNLGLEELVETIDRTRTPMGQRALRRWLERPLLEADRINQRLEAVDALTGDYMLREEAREHLSRIPDIERIATRIVRLSASPNDLLSLRGALEALGPLEESLASAAGRSSLIERALAAMEEPPGVRELIAAAISEEEGEIIRPGY